LTIIDVGSDSREKALQTSSGGRLGGEYPSLLFKIFSHFRVCFLKWRRSFSPILGQNLSGNPQSKQKKVFSWYLA